MPLPKVQYTSKDYWALPEGSRAELIDGQLYNMAPPSRIHQEITFQIARKLADYIDSKKGSCKRCLPIRKHRGAREKRYSFGYAVFLILALMK